MIAANVLSKEEFPDFDEETGILPKVDDEEGKGSLGPVVLWISGTSPCCLLRSLSPQHTHSWGHQVSPLGAAASHVRSLKSLSLLGTAWNCRSIRTKGPLSHTVLLPLSFQQFCGGGWGGGLEAGVGVGGADLPRGS